jgi:multiple sugar transport system substrate-binding protein
MGGEMKFSKKILAVVASVATLASLAACGNSDNGDSTAGGDSNEKVTINVWAWDQSITPVVAAFEKAYPNITVKLTNTGTGTDAYTALSNAIAAGSGAPDVAQIEYYALPQYEIQKQVQDLSSYGAKDYQSFYTPGTWASVNIDNGVYALPMDSGPMALFYNKAVFDKAGITTPPTTWDEYYQDAKKIKTAGSYITSDSGDAGLFDSMVWASGGDPFTTEGTDVTVNLTGDAGTKKWIDYWQKMIDEGLIDTKTVGWTDDWNRGLGDGSIASLLTGAWMPANLVSGAPDAAGDWRVAQMPTWTEGDTSNSENGGSSLAMLASSQQKDAAWKFIDFTNHSADGVKIRVDYGAFPSDNDSLKDQDWLDKTEWKDPDGNDIAYFGDQKVNQELAKAAADVIPGYHFLPFEVYARGVFADTAGQAFTGGSSLADGVAAWQKNLIDYGNKQGFTVK